jgi:hypothetical protein
VLGRFQELDDVLDRALSIVDSDPDRVDAVSRLEVIALDALRAVRSGLGDRLAQRVAEAVTVIDDLARPSQYRVLPCSALAAEAAFAQWRDEVSNATSRDRAQRTLRFLQAAAGIFPIARPRADWLRGHHLALEGRTERAAKFWRRAQDEAQALDMPYDEALANHARLTAARLEPGERSSANERLSRLTRELGVPGESLPL